MVIRKDGINVTRDFERGAQKVLKLAKLVSAQEAILKARSPSCGCGQVYDGNFNDTLVEGHGVTAALLMKNEIAVKNEEDLLKERD